MTINHLYNNNNNNNNNKNSSKQETKVEDIMSIFYTNSAVGCHFDITCFFKLFDNLIMQIEMDISKFIFCENFMSDK